MESLPVLISIPHAGTRAPEEVAECAEIGAAQIFGDSDAYTREIYDLGDAVRRVIATDVARCFVNLNRTPHELPPDIMDGVIKDTTSYGVRIYRPGREPDEAMMARLIERYYLPYHREVLDAMRSGPDLHLALDCHSMSAVGSPFARDTGRRRPLLCLGNAHGLTCPTPAVQRLADCLARSFGLPREEVALNRPFAGGFIIRSHGRERNIWVQIEISKALYLEPPWFDPETMSVAPERLRELRDMFEDSLRRFCNFY